MKNESVSIVRMKLNYLFWFAASVGVASVGSLAQGPLTPLTGPAPGMKTLEQIEPRIDVKTLPGVVGYQHVIAEPGSYILTSDLTVPASSSGVLVAANHVTLDLQGFTIRPAAGVVAFVGISISNMMSHVTVENGNVVGFSGIQIDTAANSHSCVFRELLVSGGTFGLVSTDRDRVINCRASNSADGFFCRGISMLESCVATENDTGFHFQGASVAVGCTAVSNRMHGFLVSAAGSLNDCVSVANGWNGIKVLADASIKDCLVADNGRDSAASPANRNGITTFIQGCVISGCTIRGNAQDGIASGSGTLIENNHILGNADDGIQVGNADRIIGNRVRKNNFGIFLGSSLSNGYIADNFVSDSATMGFLISGSCVLIRNQSGDNGTDYSITGSVQSGPTVVVVIGDNVGTANISHPLANLAF